MEHFPGPTARLRLRLINHLAPALLLCFLFKCRIDGFFLHFIDLCIMVLSLLLPLGRSPAPQTCLPRQRQAAWALCCLLFSLEKLMCCEISILSDCRYSNGGNQSAGETQCSGQWRGKGQSASCRSPAESCTAGLTDNTITSVWQATLECPLVNKERICSMK